VNWFAAGAAVLALPAVLLATAATQTSVLVVDVTVDEGPRIVAPVPYALARAGLALAPRDVRRLEVLELAPYMDDLREILNVLRDVPDGVFVEVEDRDDHVVISKEGDALRVMAMDGDRTRLELTLPLASLASFTEAYDRETGILHTGRLVRGLKKAPRGSLLHVVDGETEVRVRAW
jgi:hypothetical protein